MADYLVWEVLERIREDERDMLLATSIATPCRRGSPSSCPAARTPQSNWTGWSATPAWWWRSTRSGDLPRAAAPALLLVTELIRSGPDRVAALHRRAAVWNSAAGRAQAALNHAAQAVDRTLMTISCIAGRGR